jgi:S-adenosyl-L-methionine hydrolase (adenosine-forming)
MLTGRGRRANPPAVAPTTRSRQRTLLGRPIITLTTDFGLADSYVAEVKAVLLRTCGEARLIDVTHQIPRHDVLAGSITLERAVCGFPPGTVHLCVVDPGVGSERRLIVARVNGQLIVCPDNGLITWSLHRHGSASVLEITWRPSKPPSNTFHGRDLMAPVAGMLAAGESAAKLGLPIDDPVLLSVAPAGQASRRGRIIHIDVFGNATTNIPYDNLRKLSPRAVRVKGKSVGALRRTYSDVAPGEALALIGSSGLLEIAVRDGSAAGALRLRVGDEVALR